MKEAIKTAKVVIKKKDLRIQELEYQIHVNIKKEKYAECKCDDLGRMMATARRSTKSTMMATARRATKSTGNDDDVGNDNSAMGSGVTGYDNDDSDGDGQR